MLKRELVEELKKKKMIMVGAIWSNSNYDPQEEGQSPPRERMVEELENNFQTAVEEVYGLNDESDEISIDDDPFHVKGKKGLKKILGDDLGSEQTVGDVFYDDEGETIEDFQTQLGHTSFDQE